jgi:hypothetical protein
MCKHPAHVRPRRKAASDTALDRRHLGGCALDDPACLHASHLLPPRAPDASIEYCCAGRHFRKDQSPSWAWECPNVPGWLRDRREAGLQRTRHRASSLRSSGPTTFRPLADHMTRGIVQDSDLNERGWLLSHNYR